MIASCRKHGCSYRGPETYRHEIAKGVWSRYCREHHGEITSLFARAGMAQKHSLTDRERVLLFGWFQQTTYFDNERRLSKRSASLLLTLLKHGKTITDEQLLNYRHRSLQCQLS